MALTFNQALGIHPQALSLRGRRAEVLAANVANADTPNYKARDLDFQTVLAGAKSDQLSLTRTSDCHLAAPGPSENPELKYRVPSHPSVDGNSVEPDRERAEFAHNAVNYQSSLTFLGGRFRSLLTAIKGE